MMLTRCSPPLLALAAVCAFGARAAIAAVDSPRLTTDRWPSMYTIEDFAQDIVRLENARTGEEKLIALFTWNHRVMRHGYGYSEGPTRKAILDSFALATTDRYRYDVIDPVKILHVYGEGWCDTRSRLFNALCNGAGLKAETISIFDPKVRVWYRDRDGVERWHLVDPFRSWYVYTRDGSHIASYEEIVADPTLLTSPRKTSQPFAYWTNTSGFAVAQDPTSLFMPDGSIYPMLPHTSFKLLPHDYHSMDVPLRKGTRLQLKWSAAGKYYGFYEDLGEAHRCPNGPHSHRFDGPGTEHTTFASGKETVIDPANWPYVKSYYKPCDNTNCPFYNLPVKWYGNGQLTYTPNLDRLENFRDGLYSWGSYRNLTVGNNPGGEPRVRPSRPQADAWLTFRVDSPYVMVDANIDAQFRLGNTSDACTVSLSTDRGDTWREVWRSTGSGAQRANINIGQHPWKADATSAVGQYTYLVRIQMTATDPSQTGLDALQLSNDLELNMFTLPMLQPGRNRIRYAAHRTEPGDAMRVTFCWDDRDGKARQDVRVFPGLTADYTIRTAAQSPDDITMRWLMLENPAPGQPTE